jgi:hypothetical protein
MTQKMDDSALYYMAFQEVEGGDRDEALWAKAITLAEGDVDAAKYKYIKLRVARLRRPGVGDDESALVDSGHEQATGIPDGYISVTEFAARSSLDKETIIRNIVDGVWDAQKIQDHWYIPEPETLPDTAKPADTTSQPAATRIEDTPSIRATRTLKHDDDVPDVRVIAPDDWPSIASTIDALNARDEIENPVRYEQAGENRVADLELTLEPLEEDSKPVKKDMVARVASITARFVAVVAALLLITVVTNVLREMQLSVEQELVVHGTTAAILICLLYYVWIKTRIPS